MNVENHYNCHEYNNYTHNTKINDNQNCIIINYYICIYEKKLTNTDALYSIHFHTLQQFLS